ncbi:MAG: hypothetical protein KKF56_03855 [Nanoarchaeota archaeon]|nr:hypothetical protein [Nanoarchaeota archaeon]
MSTDVCDERGVRVSDTVDIPWSDLATAIVAIQGEILRTPRRTRKEVEAYHAGIVVRLDSGERVPVQSTAHRNLHEMMWLMAHQIYGGFETPEDAMPHFFNPDNGDCSQRDRFNDWYTETYGVVN